MVDIVRLARSSAHDISSVVIYWEQSSRIEPSREYRVEKGYGAAVSMPQRMG